MGLAETGRVHTGAWWGDLRDARSSCRWEDNIKIVLQEMGQRCSDWIEQARDRDRWRAIVNAVMNLRVPRNAGNLLIS